VNDFYTGASGSLTQAWPSSNFPSVPDNTALPALVIPATGASGNQFQDLPGGDNYLRTTMNGSSSTAYAKHVQDVTGTTTTTAPRALGTSSNDYDFEIFGYSFPGFTASHTDGVPAPSTAKSNFLSTILRGTGADPMGRTAEDFAGFTQGPRYWGKTF